jgi:hypothetical protein
MKIKLRPSGVDTWARLIFIFSHESPFEEASMEVNKKVQGGIFDVQIMEVYFNNESIVDFIVWTHRDNGGGRNGP